MRKIHATLVELLPPPSIVVLDNLRAHKSEATLALITTAGAQTRFLPACSPELNLIGMMWSKVKTFLRSAEAC